jgi:hypothetical protein
MGKAIVVVRILFLLLCAAFAVFPQAAIGPCEEEVRANLRIDPGHPWRPPFSLERIGRPLELAVDIDVSEAPLTYAGQLSREYFLVGYQGATEVERRSLVFQTVRPGRQFEARASMDAYQQVALELSAALRPADRSRASRATGPFQAEATAHQAKINPVDLGAILVPADWLLLRSGQSAVVEVAAIDTSGATANASVRAWWGSDPRRGVRLQRSRSRRQETTKRCLPAMLFPPSA